MIIWSEYIFYLLDGILWEMIWANLPCTKEMGVVSAKQAKIQSL